MTDGPCVSEAHSTGPVLLSEIISNVVYRDV